MFRVLSGCLPKHPKPLRNQQTRACPYGVLCAMCTSAFPPVQSENEQLVLRFQDTESSLQAVQSDSMAKEGALQSDLGNARKDVAALMENIEHLSADLAATREESQTVQAGLQVLLNTSFSSALLPTNGCRERCVCSAHQRCHLPYSATFSFPFRAAMTRHTYAKFVCHSASSPQSLRPSSLFVMCVHCRNPRLCLPTRPISPLPSNPTSNLRQP